MPNIGWSEIAMVMLIALVFIGPKRLPGFAKQAGQALREFRKTTGNLKRELKSGLALDDGPKSGRGRTWTAPARPNSALRDAPWPTGLADAPWPSSPPAEPASTDANTTQ